jgi:hypothetical protein
MNILPSAQEEYPSPINGGLQEQVSTWFDAEQTAPGAHGLLMQRFIHSFPPPKEPDKVGKSHIWFVAQSWWVVHFTSMQETCGFPW